MRLISCRHTHTRQVAVIERVLTQHTLTRDPQVHHSSDCTSAPVAYLAYTPPIRGGYRMQHASARQSRMGAAHCTVVCERWNPHACGASGAVRRATAMTRRCSSAPRNSVILPGFGRRHLLQVGSVALARRGRCSDQDITGKFGPVWS